MTIEEQIDEKKTELRRLTREIWGAPIHIATEIEPRIVSLNNEIHNLKAKLFKQNGGKIDVAD